MTPCNDIQSGNNDVGGHCLRLAQAHAQRIMPKFPQSSLTHLCSEPVGLAVGWERRVLCVRRNVLELAVGCLPHAWPPATPQPYSAN